MCEQLQCLEVVPSVSDVKANEEAHLETIALRESEVTDVTFVRFLAGVNSLMSFEFVRVGAGVRAVRTLVRAFARVRPDVSSQLAEFHRRVAALLTSMWLLVRVTISHVSHQLTRRRE